VPQSASLAFRAVFQGTKASALEPLIHEPPNSGRLRLNVLFTNYKETLRALKLAEALTPGLPSEIVLLVPVTVPFPLPIEEPPVPLGFACRRISELVSCVQGETSLEAYVFLCRNPIEAVLRSLGQRSLVLIGARRLWPFGKTRRLARKLRAAGHEVFEVTHSHS
jgi:hypothetical protein